MYKSLFKIEKPHFGTAEAKSFFRLKIIAVALLTALLFSAFIYLYYFGFHQEFAVAVITSLSALGAFYLLLTQNRNTLFWSGFFISLFWFYWIGFSFRFYGVTWLIPFMIFFVSFTYGLLFWVIGLFTHPLPRALLFLLFSYIHPVSFNWFIPELTLIHSFFGIEKWQFALFLAAIVLFISLPLKYKITSLLPLLLAINPTYNQKLPLPETKIMLTDSGVDQRRKWDEAYLPETIENNIATILDAINEKYDMVILNESVFPMFLNTDINLTKQLQELSKDIVIVAGALYSDGKNAYNSTYYFDKGKVYIANKVILVPFGEEIPLPKFMAKWINKIFYNGAEDYHTAKKPIDLKLSTGTFRNAICYEATREELFEGNPKQMIAISNNAWFTPSIEPTLQKLLMEYFSKKYGTVIYHSANKGISTTIH
jgi:apolipoprotein N-acyltransferase